MDRFFTSILFLIATALLAGCGGGTGGGTGVLAVQITDAKVDEAYAVVLHYTQVTIHGQGGNTVVDVYDPVTNQPGRSINLLEYTNGASVVLFAEELPAGNYSWMRLEMDFDVKKSYIQLTEFSDPQPLNCTSCEKNGVKLNRSFTIETDQIVEFTLDFDLRSSITLASNGTEYILRPTVRVVPTEASGAIAGTVDPTLIATLGSDGEGCAVYVFNGADAQVDDIYIPLDMPVPDTQNNPVTTAMVDSDVDPNDPELRNYTYTAAFLPVGTYTVSLTCDARQDDSATDDVLVFTGTTNASVTAGQTTTVDFDGG